LFYHGWTVGRCSLRLVHVLVGYGSDYGCCLVGCCGLYTLVRCCLPHGPHVCYVTVVTFPVVYFTLICSLRTFGWRCWTFTFVTLLITVGAVGWYVVVGYVGGYRLHGCYVVTHVGCYVVGCTLRFGCLVTCCYVYTLPLQRLITLVVVGYALHVGTRCCLRTLRLVVTLLRFCLLR